MEKKINEKTPKTHLRLMDKYCELRSNAEAVGNGAEIAKDNIARISEKEKEFNRTGTIDKETASELFCMTKAFYDVSRLKMEETVRCLSERMVSAGQDLTAKGYDLDTVYAVWDADPCMFEELAEGRRAVCE